jgi:hypothetical protein
MTQKKNVGTLTGILGLLMVLMAFGCAERTAVTGDTRGVQTQAAETVTPASSYDADIKALTTAECARCHISQFTRIKNEGGKHRNVECTDCHTIFHAYNPLRKNYADIMPKCAACHDEPHGPDKSVQKCGTCHADPHRPVVAIPDPSTMESQCKACHGKVAQSLAQNPSKHTTEHCSSCHSQKHGRIPVCEECHENHSPMVTMSTPECLSCHPVHIPLQITYSDAVSNNAICAGCHKKPFDLLKTRQTKHSPLACAACHPGHKQILACQECHGAAPHNASIHKKYPKCGDCHSIAHDLRL